MNLEVTDLTLTLAMISCVTNVTNVTRILTDHFIRPGSVRIIVTSNTVLPPFSERLAIRTMARGAALGAISGCGCRVYG